MLKKGYFGLILGLAVVVVLFTSVRSATAATCTFSSGIWVDPIKFEDNNLNDKIKFDQGHMFLHGKNWKSCNGNPSSPNDNVVISKDQVAFFGHPGSRTNALFGQNIGTNVVGDLNIGSLTIKDSGRLWFPYEPTVTNLNTIFSGPNSYSITAMEQFKVNINGPVLLKDAGVLDLVNLRGKEVNFNDNIIIEKTAARLRLPALTPGNKVDRSNNPGAITFGGGLSLVSHVMPVTLETSRKINFANKKGVPNIISTSVPLTFNSSIRDTDEAFAIQPGTTLSITGNSKVIFKGRLVNYGTLEITNSATLEGTQIINTPGATIRLKQQGTLKANILKNSGLIEQEPATTLEVVWDYSQDNSGSSKLYGTSRFGSLFNVAGGSFGTGKGNTEFNNYYLNQPQTVTLGAPWRLYHATLAAPQGDNPSFTGSTVFEKLVYHIDGDLVIKGSKTNAVVQNSARVEVGGNLIIEGSLAIKDNSQVVVKGAVTNKGKLAIDFNTGAALITKSEMKFIRPNGSTLGSSLVAPASFGLSVRDASRNLDGHKKEVITVKLWASPTNNANAYDEETMALWETEADSGLFLSDKPILITFIEAPNLPTANNGVLTLTDEGEVKVKYEDALPGQSPEGTLKIKPQLTDLSLGSTALVQDKLGNIFVNADLKNNGQVLAAKIPLIINIKLKNGQEKQIIKQVDNLGAKKLVQFKSGNLGIKAKDVMAIEVVAQPAGIKEANKDDNKKIIQPPRDLAINTIDIVHTVKNELSVPFSVFNNGSVDSGPTVAWIQFSYSTGANPLMEVKVDNVPAKSNIKANTPSLPSDIGILKSFTVTVDPENQILESNEKNNRREYFLGRDLRVSALSYAKNKQLKPEIRYAVSNDGNDPTGPFTVKVMGIQPEGSTLLGTHTISNINGKQTGTAFNRQIPDGLTAVEIAVDTGEAVGETDEKNNVRRLVLPTDPKAAKLAKGCAIFTDRDKCAAAPNCAWSDGSDTAADPGSTAAGVWDDKIDWGAILQNFVFKPLDNNVANGLIGNVARNNALKLIPQKKGTCLSYAWPEKPVLNTPLADATVTTTEPILRWFRTQLAADEAKLRGQGVPFGFPGMLDFGEEQNALAEISGKRAFLFRWYIKDAATGKIVWERLFQSDETETESKLCKDKTTRAWLCPFVKVPAGKLESGKTYLWSVEAADLPALAKNSGSSGFAAERSFTVKIPEVAPLKKITIPNKPTLTSPSDKDTTTTLMPTLSWKDAGPNKNFFRFYVEDVDTNKKIWERGWDSGENPSDKNCLDSLNRWICPYATIPAGKLQYDKSYRWSVEAGNGLTTSQFTDPWQFSVKAEYVPILFPKADPSISNPSSGSSGGISCTPPQFQVCIGDFCYCSGGG